MTSGVRQDAWEFQVRSLAAAHRGDRGALLPILHAIVAEFGHVSPDVVPIVADELNLSRAEVHGVITFYRDFRTTPPARTMVRVCRAEACQAVGATALVEHATSRYAKEPDVDVEDVFCLGNCALGPSVQIGRTTYGRVDATRLDALLAEEAANHG